MNLKRTPLYQWHKDNNGRLVEFGGWEMPVQYGSVVEEQNAVRKNAGLFDISHMGEVMVTGPGAANFLNRCLTNNILKVKPGMGQYTILCQDSGTVVDDLYAFNLPSGGYFLVINASRIDADFDWFQRQWKASSNPSEVQLENLSDSYGAIAVQGPKVKDFILPALLTCGWSNTAAVNVLEMKKNQITLVQFPAGKAWISRTGYTGEDGFEIYCPAALTETIWKALLEVGAPFGVKPCGLGARDVLRVEMGYSLYGHELSDQINPIEAGLERYVDFSKPEFVGKQALVDARQKGVAKKCIAFKMNEAMALPRADYRIWSVTQESAPIGVVSSGTHSPSLGIGVGLGYVNDLKESAIGNPIQIEIRNKKFKATVVARPLYKPVL